MIFLRDPKISVVVPVYKVERYIKLCVESILAQTFRDFEIILVDDASPDGCVDICKKFFGSRDNVRLLRHEKNLGLGAARNTGIQNARGKYIAFVDSDDLILPNALEKFFSAAEKNSAQIVRAAGYYDLFQDEPAPFGDDNLKIYWSKFSREGLLENDLFFRLDYLWKKFGLTPATWCCLYRRDFLEKNRLEFLPIICEDVPFHLACLALAERYYILHDALYIYRHRKNSIITATDAGKISRAIDSMIIGLDYIKNFLSRLPDTKEFNIWRRKLFTAYIDVFFIRQSTLPFYENLSINAEANAAVSESLEKFFGGGADFVKYFFNGYHFYRRQSEIFAEQIHRLQKISGDQ